MYSLTIDKMYLVEALTTDLPGIELPTDLLQEVNAFRRWVSAVDVLCWCAIMAVKFSFLVLFRRLIQDIKSLMVDCYTLQYWNPRIRCLGIFCVVPSF